MNNCNAAAKSSTVLDISKNKDDSVLSWVDKNTLYIGPAYSNKISVGLDASYIFAECYSVKRIEGLENLDMSECNYMDEMFRELTSLTLNIDKDNFNAFDGCNKLNVSLNISHN